MTARLRRNIYRAELPKLHDPSLPWDADRHKRVLVVSWNAVNRALRQPVCVVITGEERDRSVPTCVVLEPWESEGGVQETSYILCHAVHTLVEPDIDPHPLGRITQTKMSEVEAALARAFDLPGANDPE